LINKFDKDRYKMLIRNNVYKLMIFLKLYARNLPTILANGQTPPAGFILWQFKFKGQILCEIYFVKYFDNLDNEKAIIWYINQHNLFGLFLADLSKDKYKKINKNIKKWLK